MATGSLRRKLNKRSDPRPYTPMAARPKSSNYRNTSLILSVVLIVGVFILLGISSNIWSNVSFSAVSTNIFSIEVVNEFPHDPNAFTQVILVVKFSEVYL